MTSTIDSGCQVVVLRIAKKMGRMSRLAWELHSEWGCCHRALPTTDDLIDVVGCPGRDLAEAVEVTVEH